MKPQRHIIHTIAAICIAATMQSCIEDGFTYSPADQPEFSTDTLRLGDLFTLGPSPTSRFIVYNRHDKSLNISHVAFSDDPKGMFRINVDGMSGREFHNVEIRPNDSIFVFVEATLAENNQDTPVDILAHIDFLVNGTTSRMPVKATGQDVTRLTGNTRITTDQTLSPSKPYQIFDSIVVEQGTTLTIPAGTRLYFHDNSRLVIHGTLNIDGNPQHPVTMTGDRSGYVAADIPYEIMSGQWQGIEFTPTSTANRISHASIRNSTNGITLDNLNPNENATDQPLILRQRNSSRTGSQPALWICNSVIRNTKNYVIEAIHSDITVIGCELTDASMGLLRLVGGNHIINHATIANYYLFTALGGPAIQFSHIDPSTSDGSERPYLSADITNTIIYGNGTELSHGDLEGLPVTLRRCLLKSNGTDDNNFIDCLWGVDPLYYTDREAYLFDYRLQPGSPAYEAADPALTMPETNVDLTGEQRLPSPSLGAYQSPQ